MKYDTLSARSIEQLAADAIASTPISFANLLTSVSEVTSCFVPSNFQPIWKGTARLASRTIEILPFAAAAAIQDIARSGLKRTVNQPRRENLGARLRREEVSLPVPAYPGRMEEV